MRVRLQLLKIPLCHFCLCIIMLKYTKLNVKLTYSTNMKKTIDKARRK